MIIRIFAVSVPTKPLNDAQMRGAFLGSSVKCMDVNLNLRVKTLNKGWHFVSLYKPKKKNT